MRTTQTSRLFVGFRPTRLFLSCLTIAALVGCGASAQTLNATDAGDAGVDAGMDAGPASTPITLVEVFGSEGCGKCPTVEEAVNPYASEGSDGFFSVEYHVTYSSPWVDVYASMTYDTLAGNYLQPYFPSGSFTYGLPALFINAQYVKDTLYPYTKAISQIPKSRVTPQASIVLSLKSASTANPLVVNYDVTFAAGGPTSGMIGVVFVERGIVSDIMAGDNQGINLHEENVARAFSSAATGNESGFAKLNIPADAVRSNSSVIAFVKDNTYQTLYGASELDL
jgi:hypothetical protein